MNECGQGMRLGPPLLVLCAAVLAAATAALVSASAEPSLASSSYNASQASRPMKPDPCKNMWRYPYNCVKNCIYMIVWRHVPENDTIEFVVTTKNSRRWTGVGFSPNKNLTNSDAVFAWIENSTRYVMMDAFLESYSKPRSDKQQSIFHLNARGSYEGIFVFKFVRARNTSDEEDFLFSDTNCPYVIFPVDGGSIDHTNRTVITTEYQPLVSEFPVCFTACDSARKFNFTNIKVSRVSKEVISPSQIVTTAATSNTITTTPVTTTATITTTNPLRLPPQSLAPSRTTTPATSTTTTSTTTSTTTTTTTTTTTPTPTSTPVPTTTSTTTQPPPTTSTKVPSTTTSTSTSTTPKPPTSSTTSGERLENAASEPAVATEQQQWCSGRWLFPAGCRFQQPETVSYLQAPVDRTRVIQPVPLELSDCTYAAQWQYQEARDMIQFIIQTKTRNRWTGLGFSNSTRMPNSDAIIGLIDEQTGRHFIMDTWLKDHVMPDIDAQQNALDTYGKRENGTTTIRFSRPRKTQDPHDFQFTDDSCAYFFFPTQGGSFNAISKRLYKHEQTPSVSRQRICIRACTIGDTLDQSPATSQPELVSSPASPPVTVFSSTRPPQATSTAASSHDINVDLDNSSTLSAEEGGNSSLNVSGVNPFMRLGFLSEPSLRWLAGIGCVATLLAMIVFQACFTVYRNKQAYKQALFRQSAFKQNAYLHAQATSSVTTSYPSTQTAIRTDEDEPKKRAVVETVDVDEEEEEDEEVEEGEMELEDEGEYNEDGFDDDEEYDDDDELAMERSLNYAHWRARYAHPHQHPNQHPNQHPHQHIHPHQHSHPHHRQHQQPYPHLRPHQHSQSHHRQHQHSHHPHQHRHYYSPHPLQAHLPNSRSQSQAARPDAYFLPSQRRY